MKIGVTGITGRMGRTIAGLVLQDSVAELISAFARKNSGEDLGEFLGFEKTNTQATSNLDQFVKS